MKIHHGCEYALDDRGTLEVLGIAVDDVAREFTGEGERDDALYLTVKTLIVVREITMNAKAARAIVIQDTKHIPFPIQRVIRICVGLGLVAPNWSWVSTELSHSIGIIMYAMCITGTLTRLHHNGEGWLFEMRKPPATKWPCPRFSIDPQFTQLYREPTASRLRPKSR